jgi:hypothetical protein
MNPPRLRKLRPVSRPVDAVILALLMLAMAVGVFELGAGFGVLALGSLAVLFRAPDKRLTRAG